jgi:hypothetical protein
MATSPNYGWLEPDNTDLVKNGALAIRTLGNAIDTTMATMTPKSTYTAKGSIAAATGASTPANLAVGNNGETLVADSSTSTGLRYTGGTVISNPLINSCMDIWQRGTSIANTASTLYTADRWVTVGSPAAFTISRQATSDTTNLPNVQYCARVQRNSGQTNTTGFDFLQGFETSNSIPYAGKTVTMSFYARAGANYSPTSSILQAQLYSGTGTDQSPTAAFTGQATVINQNATLTTTWQRFTYTASVGATATQLKTIFSMAPTGTAGANDFYEITGVQLDIGSVALPVRRNGATIQGELSACQRYYIRQGGDTAFQTLASGYGASTTTAVTTMILPGKMRVAPTSVDFSTIRVHNTSAGYAITAVAIDTNFNSSFQAVVTSTIGSASLTIANGYIIGANNSTSAYLGFSAEL